MKITRANLHAKGSLLSRPVVKLPGGKDHLSWAELTHGCICLGNAGSGKTSGPGQWFMRDILADPSKPGMMALCVKADERQRIESMVIQAGRAEDLVILSAENSYTVGVLEHELFRKGRGAADYNSALNVLMEVFLFGEHYQAGGATGNSEDRYWDKALRLRLNRLMMILVLSNQSVSIQNMRRIMVDSFSIEDVQRYVQLWEQMDSEDNFLANQAERQYLDWMDGNYFLHCFEILNQREDLSEEQMHHVQLVGDYFLKENPGLSEKTRSIVDSSVTGLFEPFNTGVLHSHFGGDMSEEVKPERCYKQGAIIIVDIPLKEFGISAVYGVGIMKKLFQLCQERRQVHLESNPRPVVFWCDEFHYFVSALSDDTFQSSCRSTLTACVYLTQSINNLRAAIGKDVGEAKTKAFLTNVGTQVYCGNVCVDTNTHAAQLIGKAFVQTHSSSYNSDDRASKSSSEQLHWIVPPEHFTRLRSGGPGLHNYKVDTIMVVRGKNWSTGERFAEVTFDQRGRQPGLLNRLTSLFK